MTIPIVDYSKWKSNEIKVLDFSRWPVHLFFAASNLLYKLNNKKYTPKFAELVDMESIKITFNSLEIVYVIDKKENVGVNNPCDNLIHLMDAHGNWIN